jgi:hypothetical protein
MQALTEYISRFRLTTLIDSDSALPLWLGGGGNGTSGGMALFVSALDAEIYRHVMVAAGNPNWHRVRLANFDLKQLIEMAAGALMVRWCSGSVRRLAVSWQPGRELSGLG